MMTDIETQELKNEMHKLTVKLGEMAEQLSVISSYLMNDPKTDEKGLISRVRENQKRLDQLEDYKKKLATQLALIGGLFSVLGSVIGFLISKFM